MTHLVRARGPNPCPFGSNVCTYKASVQAQNLSSKLQLIGAEETPPYFFWISVKWPLLIFVCEEILLLSEWHVRINCYTFMLFSVRAIIRI